MGILLRLLPSFRFPSAPHSCPQWADSLRLTRKPDGFEAPPRLHPMVAFRMDVEHEPVTDKLATNGTPIWFLIPPTPTAAHEQQPSVLDDESTAIAQAAIASQVAPATPVPGDVEKAADKVRLYHC
jgi:hypothetical protein